MMKAVFASVLGWIVAAGLVCANPPEGGPVPASAPANCSPNGAAPNCPVCVGTSQDDGYATAEVDYILWFLQKDRFGNELFGTDQFRGPGALSNAQRDQNNQSLSGARLTLGYWLEDFDPVMSPHGRMAMAGVEGTGFFLAERSLQFLSGAAPALVRPFFDLNSASVNAVVVAAPGLAVGQLSANADARLWGLELNGWCNVWSNPPGQTFRADVMAGFRFLELDGDLRINQQTRYNTDLAAFPDFIPLAGSRLDAFDSFDVDNKFYGAQVGLKLHIILACADISTTFKYGLGGTHQRLNINGGQVLTAADGTQTQSLGGLLALPTNIGDHAKTRLSQVPEGNLSLNISVSRCLSIRIGYNVLFISNVIRAPDQIDRVIDVTQIPNFPGAGAATPTGLARPAVLFRESALAAQGLELGFKFAW